ncbi:hypothetical protein B0I37DRAFT_217727 [Chaetomium sp. MPI-CAGE-AT-0009]|nr:hypothetical protein B0I37DRAFT_217727 [Chaetomium sp. MPI-CAGE-AT-0009]
MTREKDMESKTSRALPAPEYSQLPEVSSAWGTEAPEAVDVGPDTAKAVPGPYVSSDGNWLPPQYPKPPFQASRSPFPIATDPNSPGHGFSTASTKQDGEGSRKKTILILSILVGVLAAAVVGLATATGLMARRASNAESANPQQAINGTCPTVTTTAATATATTTVVISTTGASDPPAPVVDLSNGCSDRNERISGTTYTTQIFGKVGFIRYCNAQLKEFPIYGMLTLDFEACMDACAAWSSKGPEVLGEDNPNAICGGVRFVPAWTNRTLAWATNARGNCFLHKTPQTVDDLMEPDLKDKVPCHAAILVEKR